MKPPTPANSGKLGVEGEKTARSLLESLGYAFLEANYRTPYGEIDLIFRDSGVLVLVEVKTRRTGKKPLQNMEETIDKRKINRILKSAEIYIERSGTVFDEIRIDAVLIENSERGQSVRHLKNFY